jgi:hypothetical protein
MWALTKLDGTTGVYTRIESPASDVTPPYVIYRILTSAIWGFQTSSLFGQTITAAKIDMTSYNAAVAYCEAQGLLISVTYTGQDNVLNIFNELLALYSGYLTVHAGKIYFGIVQAGDTSIRTIDNTHLISEAPGKPPVKVTKGAAQDTYNIIEFQFLSRLLEYNQDQVWVSDEVDVDFNGPKVKTYQAKFVMANSTAFQCAERALWSNLYGKDTYTFKLGAKDADLRPGNQITLVDSYDNTLSGGVQAIITEWQENKRLEFDAKAVRVFQDHISATHGTTAVASPGQGIGSMVQPVKPVRDARAYELPTQFHTAEPEMFVGSNQDSLIMGAQLWLSNDGTTYALDEDVQPFLTSGILGAALPVRPPGYVEHNVPVVMMPTSSFSIATPTFVQTADIDDASVSARQAGLTCIIVGSEAIALEEPVLTAQNQYRITRMFRGWGGTPVSAQNSGAYWHHHGGGIFAHALAISDIGKLIYYKVLPYGFNGTLLDISSCNARTYMIKGDFWLPRQQPLTEFYVNSNPTWSANSPIIGPFVTVLSGGESLIL